MLLGAGLFGAGALAYRAFSRPTSHTIYESDGSGGGGSDYFRIVREHQELERRLQMTNDVMLGFLASQVAGKPESPLLALGAAAGLPHADFPFLDLEDRVAVGRKELTLGKPQITSGERAKLIVPMEARSEFFTNDGYFTVERKGELVLFDDVQNATLDDLLGRPRELNRPRKKNEGEVLNSELFIEKEIILYSFKQSLEYTPQFLMDFFRKNPSYLKLRIEEAMRAHPIERLSDLQPECRKEEAIKYLQHLGSVRLNGGQKNYLELIARQVASEIFPSTNNWQKRNWQRERTFELGKAAALKVRESLPRQYEIDYFSFQSVWSTWHVGVQIHTREGVFLIMPGMKVENSDLLYKAGEKHGRKYPYTVNERTVKFGSL